MKVNTRALREAVDNAARMIRSTAIPITGFVRLTPTVNGLSLTSTNLDEFLVQSFKAQDFESFKSCLVQPRHLLAALYLAGEEVEIEQTCKELVIKSAATVCVKTADADEFPAMPAAASTKKEISCAELAAGIKSVAFCANTNPARIELCSVHFASNDGKMVVEAVDGANGAFYEFPWVGDLTFLVSAEHAGRLQDALLKEGAELFLTGNLASVKHALGSYSCKLLEAQFPNTKAMRTGENFVMSKPLGEISAETVAETLSAALLLWDANQLPAMNLEFTPKAMSFESDAFNRQLEGKFANHSTKVNAQALRKCVQAFGEQAVKIGTGQIDFLRLEAGKLSAITMSLREK